MRRDAIAIKPGDNVATAIRDLAAGEAAQVGCGEKTWTVELKQDIAYGHKLALAAIAVGQEVLKYGTPIGRASRAIAAGEHVHVHNLESQRGRGDLA